MKASLSLAVWPGRCYLDTNEDRHHGAHWRATGADVPVGGLLVPMDQSVLLDRPGWYDRARPV